MLSGEDPYRALLLLRNTPGDNLISPAERLIGRKTRNKLCVSRDLLKSKTAENICEKLRRNREIQKRYADRGSQTFKEIPVNCKVCVQNADGSWSSGRIKVKKGDRSYLVSLDDGRELWRNSHFIRPTKVEDSIIPEKCATVQ